MNLHKISTIILMIVLISTIAFAVYREPEPLPEGDRETYVCGDGVCDLFEAQENNGLYCPSDCYINDDVEWNINPIVTLTEYNTNEQRIEVTYFVSVNKSDNTQVNNTVKKMCPYDQNPTSCRVRFNTELEQQFINPIEVPHTEEEPIRDEREPIPI